MRLKTYYNLKKTKPDREFYERSRVYKDMLEALDVNFYTTYLKILRKYTSPADIIIDGGSGYAKAFVNFLGKRKIICIDWSMDFLKKAKQNYKQGIFIQADLCRMPLKENSINFIGLFDALEHLYDVGQFFEEARKVLCKGGKILIISPNLDSLFMPLLRFYYSKKYGFKLGHEKYISLTNLVTETAEQIIAYLKGLLSNYFEVRYKYFKGDMKYTDDDTIFYSSYFITKYIKAHGFKIFKRMSAPISKPKYLFAKVFPSMFPNIYLIAEKI